MWSIIILLTKSHNQSNVNSSISIIENNPAFAWLVGVGGCDRSGGHCFKWGQEWWPLLQVGTGVVAIDLGGDRSGYHCFRCGQEWLSLLQVGGVVVIALGGDKGGCHCFRWGQECLSLLQAGTGAAVIALGRERSGCYCYRWGQECFSLFQVVELVAIVGTRKDFCKLFEIFLKYTRYGYFIL